MNQSAPLFRPDGASHASPGQRPGNEPRKTSQALKGRPNRCPNPWHASTFTSSSAQKTANPLSPIPSATRCTPTWPPSCKISAALRFLSIPWKTTSTCFSTLPERYLSARSSKTLKNPRPNGSRPKDWNSPHLHGSRDTVHSPYPNPMWKPSANTSPTNANTIARKPSKKNTGHSSIATMYHSMNGMFGIEPVQSANGATHASPGQRPGNGSKITNQALKGRPNLCPNPQPAPTVRPGFQPSLLFKPAYPGRCPGLAWIGASPLWMGGQR